MGTLRLAGAVRASWTGQTLAAGVLERGSLRLDVPSYAAVDLTRPAPRALDMAGSRHSQSRRHRRRADPDHQRSGARRTTRRSRDHGSDEDRIITASRAGSWPTVSGRQSGDGWTPKGVPTLRAAPIAASPGGDAEGSRARSGGSGPLTPPGRRPPSVEAERPFAAGCRSLEATLRPPPARPGRRRVPLSRPRPRRGSALPPWRNPRSEERSR